jgi:hypothetical protein
METLQKEKQTFYSVMAEKVDTRDSGNEGLINAANQAVNGETGVSES